MLAKYILEAQSHLHSGGVIAYPTESCFGLGCDPECTSALKRIYALKQRPTQMPFILIISQWAHLDQFSIDINPTKRSLLEKSWPGPTTWLIPIKHSHPLALNNKLAIRMTNHVQARLICDAWQGAIVSTSANPHSLPSAKTHEDVSTYFGNNIDYIVPGTIGSRKKPSDIFDLETEKKLR